MTDRPLRVAVIDGDSGFLQVLARRMDAVGWEHRQLASLPSVAALVRMRLGAVVVDPGAVGGTDALGGVFTALPALPVVVCTGPSSVAERVRGLRLGADDWVTKPCHPEEVVARVEAAVRARRIGSGPGGEGYVAAGELEVRADRFQAFVAGESVELTRREFELLALLAGADGRVLEREEIYRRVWGYAMARGDRSVDVFVRKLRAKLEAASPGWRYVHTQHGVGYRFAAEPIAATAAEPTTGPLARTDTASAGGAR